MKVSFSRRICTRRAIPRTIPGSSPRSVLDCWTSVDFVFDLVNRLADAFDFSFGNEDRRLAEARALVRIAYRVPSFFLA